jgi:cytochrome c-type biogenesis protein CcmE
MAEITWEKPVSAGARVAAKPKGRAKFAVAAVLMFAAMGFMMFSGTMLGGKFFITVDEVLSRPELHGKTVKMTGAVVGETIQFDAATQTIRFTIAHVPDNIEDIERAGGLAVALHEAVENPDASRVQIVVRNQPMPDLLQNEAQAIVTGKLGEDGVFYADELLLKCPSKYENEVPQQSANALN